MSTPVLLQLRRVGRVLAGRCAVEGLNLTLERGCVLGLLGVNGAGKSTTLRIVAGLLAPSAGQVLLDGTDLHENPHCVRSRLGYLPEQVPLYDELRVNEYLDFCARLHGLRGPALTRAVDGVMQRCALGDLRARLLGVLSKGQRQRVGIAQAIVHAPALIVLDEPASGLDPVQSAQLRALIGELRSDHGVIVSTHQLADVQACCDRVAILHQGRLRHDGPLQSRAAESRVHVRLSANPGADDWRALAAVRAAERTGDGWRVALTPDANPEQLAAQIVARGWGLRELRADIPDLAEIFLRCASADDVRDAA